MTRWIGPYRERGLDIWALKVGTDGEHVALMREPSTGRFRAMLDRGPGVSMTETDLDAAKSASEEWARGIIDAETARSVSTR